MADTKPDKRSQGEEIKIFNGTRISDFASKKLDVKKTIKKRSLTKFKK